MQAAYRNKVNKTNFNVLDFVTGIVSCVIVISIVSFVGIDFFVKLTNSL